jgi:hypothetical protein
VVAAAVAAAPTAERLALVVHRCMAATAALELLVPRRRPLARNRAAAVAALRPLTPVQAEAAA